MFQTYLQIFNLILGLVTDYLGNDRSVKLCHTSDEIALNLRIQKRKS